MNTSVTIIVKPEARPLDRERPADGYQASVTFTWNDGPYVGQDETYWYMPATERRPAFWTTPMGVRLAPDFATLADIMLATVTA